MFCPAGLSWINFSSTVLNHEVLAACSIQPCSARRGWIPPPFIGLGNEDRSYDLHVNGFRRRSEKYISTGCSAPNGPSIRTTTPARYTEYETCPSAKHRKLRRASRV